MDGQLPKQQLHRHLVKSPHSNRRTSRATQSILPTFMTMSAVILCLSHCLSFYFTKCAKDSSKLNPSEHSLSSGAICNNQIIHPKSSPCFPSHIPSRSVTFYHTFCPKAQVTSNKMKYKKGHQFLPWLLCPYTWYG